jgi:hypothetical protein
VNIQRLSAVLIITGFVFLVISGLVNAPGFYQTQDIAERVQLVNQNQVLWNANILLNYLVFLLTTVGVSLLSIHLWRNGASLFAVFGAISYAVGSVFYALVIFSRNADLLGFLEGNYPDYHGFGNWFVLAGLLLLGTAFLQAGMPTWLSYLTMGVSMVLATVLLIWPTFFFMIPFLAIGLLLVIGIVVLRQLSPKLIPG